MPSLTPGNSRSAPKWQATSSSVDVTDNQHVKAGAPIAEIDDRDYAVALQLAEAQVAQADAGLPNIDAQIAAQQAQVGEAKSQVSSAAAALTFAQQENDRYQHLARTGAGTVERAQQAQSALLQAQATDRQAQSAVNAATKQVAGLEAQRISATANLAQAKAQRDQAKLNLSYTKIAAAQGGHITHLTAAKGQYVQVGQSITMFVPDEIWVTANFKETAITDMRPGQPVSIEIDYIRAENLKVTSTAFSLAPVPAFSLLPPENATGNYVKVVQRIPVKIAFDRVPQDVVLGPGMSVVPTVKVR